MIRLKEIKKSNPLIAKELEKLINTIASYKIEEESEIKIAYKIIELREKLNI